jgi:DNA-binding transcriptional MerR regulator
MIESVEIPNKSSFKVNEVCALTGVKSYVLRFWESEFPEISPLMSSSGLKLYEHKDIEAILLIKKLLFEDKLSIEKAKAEVNRQMPRGDVVSDHFSSVSDEFFDNNFFEDSKIPQIRHDEISDEKASSLEAAKIKLHEILRMTEAIQQKNNWF